MKPLPLKLDIDSWIEVVQKRLSNDRIGRNDQEQTPIFRQKAEWRALLAFLERNREDGKLISHLRERVARYKQALFGYIYGADRAEMMKKCNLGEVCCGSSVEGPGIPSDTFVIDGYSHGITTASQTIARADVAITIMLASPYENSDHPIWVMVTKSRAGRTSRHAFSNIEDATAFIQDYLDGSKDKLAGYTSQIP